MVRDVDRNRCDGVSEGFASLHLAPDGEILGATIVAERAGDHISEAERALGGRKVEAMLDLSSDRLCLGFLSAGTLRSRKPKLLGTAFKFSASFRPLSQVTLCMQNGIRADELAGVMHPYPTSAEALHSAQP